ncbi:uncharacterized protein [Nicotiana sylvestris]|uniref:uncharacterized protein n=1 Tax=Nicotiana sylvestris TaxID=4096 RepID=UPI00388CA4CA
MWDKLEVTYEGTRKVKETHINMLVHDYELFSIKEGRSIEEIFARFNKIISNLKAFGKPYTSGDQLLKRRILRRLVKKKKIVAFKTSTEIAENEIDDDPEALQEEIAMLSRNMDGLMRIYMNIKKERIPPRQYRQYNEHDKNDGKCYECGRFGYIQAACLELKRKISRDILDLTLKESQKIMNELNKLTKEVKDWKLKHDVCEIEKEVLQEEFEELQMQLNDMRKSTRHSSEHHRISRKGKWYLDSACSSHMTGDKNLYKEVTKIDGGSVKFGDDSKGKIIGTRIIPFDNNCDITEVYLVDGLNYNLLSISQLCDSGYEVNFKKTGCAIEDKSGKIVLPGKRYGNVYVLDSFEKIDGHICLTSMSDDPWLWHKKLGHASITASIGVKKYAFVIVDDYSRFTWLIFLSHKDEALRNFEVFCKKVEREKGYLISTIQSDHEGEFESRAFEDFYNDQGVDISAATESTGKIGDNEPDQPIESTTNVVRPNEWRSEPEYPQKFIIGDPNEGMKTMGALKKKANIALISQDEPKKIEEALKDSSWV